MPMGAGMTKHLRLLLVEDRADDAELLLHELLRAGFTLQWQRVETEDEYARAITSDHDVILADYSLPQFDALSALRILSEAGLDIPVIVVTGAMNEETCVASLRHGAVDYLLKDRLTRLGPAVENAIGDRNLRRARQAAERTAAHYASTLRAVVDNAPTGIYLKDTDGRYLMVNSELERILGLPSGRASGRTDHELLPADAASELSRYDVRCQRQRTIIEQEEVRTHSGEAHTYLSVRYPLLDRAGRVYAVGAVYADITRHKKVEDELRTARTELQRQAEHLQRANADLQDLDQAKNDFIASVSHELRTPLTSITGYTEMLADGDLGELDPAARKVVAIIDRNGRRLLGLIDDLLTLLSVDRGAFVLHQRPTDLGGLVRTVYAAVRPSLDSARIEMTVDVAPDLPAASADPEQIERVLLNLVGNAIKFSRPGDTVTVTVHSRPGAVVVDIVDTGIGISEADQTKLFQRFNRAAVAHQYAIPGTGLGLALSKDIVEHHGGTIQIRSRVGAGTTVTVTIPTADAPDPVAV
jgi:PAS domain S-box-containing protein